MQKGKKYETCHVFLRVIDKKMENATFVIIMLHFSYTLYIERNRNYLTGKMQIFKIYFLFLLFLEKLFFQCYTGSIQKAVPVRYRQISYHFTGFNLSHVGISA